VPEYMISAEQNHASGVECLPIACCSRRTDVSNVALKYSCSLELMWNFWLGNRDSMVAVISGLSTAGGFIP